MSLSMEQALTIGQAFRTDTLQEKRGDTTGFKKAHIKNLSASDRKICYQALSKIEKAQLSDFDPQKGIAAVLDADRVQSITDKIVDGPAPVDPKKTGWYAKPFLWIAHKAHSFFLWFKNTFMGRVSTDKLWNKVETYLNDVHVARARLESLVKTDIDEVEEKKRASVKAQKDFLEQDYLVLLEAHRLAQMIGLTYDHFEEHKCKLNSEWILEGFNKDVIPQDSFKDVIVGAYDDASNGVKALLQRLYDLAQKDETTEEALKEEFKTFSQSIAKQLEEKGQEGNRLAEQLKKDHQEHFALLDESTLIQKKYFE